jgi:endonuclease YncB( thermonuclease family)
MKCLLCVLFILICFVSICQTKCVVTRVIDGDTYEVLYHQQKVTVRLQNGDAPELDQYFGKAAKDSVSKLILGSVITLAPQGSDIYGRTIISASYKGMPLDSFLIAKGWAWFYTSYSKNLDLKYYEAAAKLKALGLWRCDHSVPPWIWRKLNRRNKRLYEMCQ